MKRKYQRKNILMIAGSVLLFVGSFMVRNSQAAEELRLSKGQTIYVPVYSNIYVGDRELSWDLSANLSVRNTDPSDPITLLAVDYYDSDGKLVRRYLSKPKQLNPMGASYYYVKTSDNKGGWGANFIVKWKSEKEVNAPVIECVMSGLRGSHSVSFLSSGRVVVK